MTLDGVIRRRLANGLRVLVRRDASAPVVAIVTYVSAGYFDETDDVSGIAHVLEHMYFKGTRTRAVGEIARQTKAVGGYLNAATIYDHTSYYTVVPSTGFVAALEIQADAFTASSIDAGELRRELEVIVEEAKRKADNPGAVAVETLHELLHDHHRMRRWRIGREEGLRALTREAMMKFYRNFYHPSNAVLCIVGDVEPARAFAEVERLYGSLPPGEPDRAPGPEERGPAGFRYRDLAGDIGQTQLVMGWRTPPTRHEDTAALDLLSIVLGGGRASRLYRAVRERQLASSVTAYNYTPTALGVFVVHAEAQPHLAAAAAAAVRDQVRAARSGEISAGEIVRAQRIFESQWVRRLEDMEGQANHLAEWEALGDWTLGNKYLARVLGLTAADLQQAAARWLGEEEMSTLVYRPRGTPPLADDGAAWRRLLDEVPVAPLAAVAPPPEPLLAGTSSAPVCEREEAGVRVYRTAGGVPVLVRRKAGAPLVHAGVFVLGGSVTEPPDLAGLTTLMARTAVKGTTSRTAAQIAEAAEMLGGSITASVGSDSHGWSFSVPTARVASAVALLADVVQHPEFSEAALDTERAVAIADVVSLRDDIYRYPMRLAMRSAWAGHPYGSPAAGDKTTLPRISREAIARCHGEQVLHAPAVIALVGDGDPDALAQLAIAAFDRITYRESTAPPMATWPASAIETVEHRDRAQSGVAMLFPGPTRASDDRFAAALLGGIASGLGGRFFDELRDRQSLCYTVQAFPSDRRLGGVFASYIATSPEKEERALAGLLDQFAILREELVTAEELDRARTYALGVQDISRQSGGAVLGEVVDAWLFGALSDLATDDDRLRAVTREGIREMARRYFDPARRVTGTVRGRLQSADPAGG